MKNQLSLLDEIVVDNFAGSGGASTGIEMATGMSVHIAINHDPAAITLHKANHPDTEHYCESVWEVDPVEAVRGRKVGLAWFSPDCKHFSRAKGGKPMDNNIRGLAWVAVKWAAKVNPRVIMLENVAEFQTWGPLLKDGRPDPKRKGKTFRTFIKSLENLGYEVQWRELRACDYGAPTIRKRLFLIARCDGKPIIWPEPTHGNPKSKEVKSGRLKPWRTASEVIDWSIGTPSIFNREKPLSENTLRRIANGIQKFAYDMSQPLSPASRLKEGKALKPVLIQMGYGDSEGRRVLDLKKPLGTITAGGNKFALATAYFKEKKEEYIRNLKDEKSSIVSAFLTKYYGCDIGQSIEAPLHTITTKDRFGLVTLHGKDYQITDIGLRMLQPHELFKAQGFPPGYVIDRDHEGNFYSKAKQVARCGNSVPPPFAEHLVRANLPELCSETNRYQQAVSC